MYAMLREELAQDPLLGKQPTGARQWLTEVRRRHVGEKCTAFTSDCRLYGLCEQTCIVIHCPFGSEGPLHMHVSQCGFDAYPPSCRCWTTTCQAASSTAAWPSWTRCER